MKESIENILALETTSTNKLILIYLKLNGDGCISQSEFSKKVSCSPSGLHKCLKALSQAGYLEIDNKTYRQNYYKALI